MKKTILISMIVLLVSLVSVSALGMAAIKDMYYGDVQRGDIITKDFKVFPLDTDYIPYTEVPIPEGYFANIRIESIDPWVSYVEYHEVPWNEYTYIPVTLKIPRKKVEYKTYEEYIYVKFYLYGLNTGVGVPLSYTVVKKQGGAKHK